MINYVIKYTNNKQNSKYTKKEILIIVYTRTRRWLEANKDIHLALSPKTQIFVLSTNHT